MIRLIAIFWCLFATQGAAETMRMAVTTSFENSGLADVLLPAIEKDTGITLQLLVVGTGQALRLGAAGDVDAVLVHARAAEEAFVAAGHATHRREIMVNDFVLIGPAEDPAGLTQVAGVGAAMGALAQAQAPFVSRGDDSGTHRAEGRLWAAAGLDPAGFGRWYRSVGAGMGAALNTASGMQAYILSDRATWLSFGNKGGLQILFEGDPALENQYSFLPVSPDVSPAVRHDLALTVETWLLGPRAAALIDGFQVGGQRLFRWNAAG